MITNIINDLSDKYKHWNLEHKHSEEFIFHITGSNKAQETDLFMLLGDITRILDFNVNIKINRSDFLSVIVSKHMSESKYKKMYTSGCFDVFHYGHLNILKKTREICDYLVVGVSTDELIEKEKGRKAFIPFAERVKILEAIKFVDEVIPQVDKNKQRIVDEHNIDAISVGDDWRGRYPKTTCPIEYFTYTDSVSSTILKETLNIVT